MNLNYSAAFNFRTGYSIASTYFGLELSNLDHNLCLFPIGGVSKEQYIQKWFSENYYKVKSCDYQARGLKLWHQGDLLEFPVCSARIGFPIFELNQFTNQELNSLKSLDKLIVCSEWARQICLNNNVLTEKEVFVCPLGVDSAIFRPRTKPQTDKFIFVNVGKISKNKGHDVLPIIFNKAFTKKDEVELWMFTDNPFLNEQEKMDWFKLYLDTPLGNKIKFFPPQNTQADLAINLAKADAAIFPIRGEGWNLPMLECMSMSIPCITSNYSGQTQFINYDNTFLVEIDVLEPAVDNKWFFGQGQWAKLSESQIDQFVDHMRFVYNNKINSNPEGIKTSQRLTWSNSAQILSNIIFG